MTRSLPPVPSGYVVTRFVAEGGMGVVLEAEQAALRRRVALKVLHPRVAASPDSLARFRREARVLAQLSHPHAVQVFDFVDAPEPTLVMEFIDGESAESRLRRDGPFPVEVVATLADQVLSVLEVLHANAIVHRDLKPANLMLEAGHAAPFVRLIDFGIAVVTTEAALTKEGQVSGTPATMSPEQISGQPVDDRSDQYSLACVLFELLTGRAPFEAAAPMHVLSAHLFREPPTLESCGVVVPHGFQAALRRALEKSPTSRFPDTATFRAALREGLVATREKTERAVAPMAPGFIAAEVDDPHLVLELDGAPVAEREAVLTALASIGVATTDGGPGAVRWVWPRPGEDLVARARAALQQSAVVLVCGPDDDLGLMTRAIEAGVHDYLPLPLELGDVGRRVVRALRAGRRR